MIMKKEFKIYQLFLTKNNNYKTGKKQKVKGIMFHSTGANNPFLSRYVGPDDGILGQNKYNNHWNQPKPDGRSVCVHAFIGYTKDKKSIATYQTLPWDHVGWHSGSGKKGSANTQGYIGFEICEDGLQDKKYFDAVYEEAINLSVYLCKKYNLTEKDIIDHSEGYRMGIASNHGDVRHWFSRFSKSMDTVRRDVALRLKGDNIMGSVFKDVKDNRWSAKHIKAAKELGIIEGTGDGNFNPTGNLTREQSAVIMVRLYEKITGKKVVE